MNLISKEGCSSGKGEAPKNIDLSNGRLYAKARKKGGLGIKDIGKMNISLLCKWWWRLKTEKGVWQDIVKAKYLKMVE